MLGFGFSIPKVAGASSTATIPAGALAIGGYPVAIGGYLIIIGG